MAKQFLDEDSLFSFVVRKTQYSYEPLISILKIIEVYDDDTIVLFNLMTGLGETTTKELITKDYETVTGDSLHKLFLWIYDAHKDAVDQSDEMIEN